MVYVRPLLLLPPCQGWHSWPLERELKESKISKCKPYFLNWNLYKTFNNLDTLQGKLRNQQITKVTVCEFRYGTIIHMAKSSNFRTRFSLWACRWKIFCRPTPELVQSPDSGSKTRIWISTFLSGTFDHQTSLNFAAILFKLTALEILRPTFAVLFQDEATVK